MPKQDNYGYIPWIGVVLAGLILGALGRYIALQQTGDTGTANLTFIIVLVGVVFMYFLFMVLWESIHQIITKRKTAQEQPDDQPEEVIEDTVIEEFSEEEVIADSIEEEVLPPADIKPEPEKPDWKELHEKEVQAKLSIFREYTHLTMGPYVSETELARLDEYVELFMRESPLPQDTMPMKPTRLKNPDLFHFGWNMQYHFQVGKREDVVPWLQKVFTGLDELEFSTIKGKLHDYQTEKYIIPNIDDIPKYMASKKA